MARQVITITKAGGVFGLRAKPGAGIDLTQFGRASVQRVTEIEWNEDGQCWTITWTAAGRAKLPAELKDETAWKAKGQLPRLAPEWVRGATGAEVLPSGALGFPTYEAAVAFEVDRVAGLQAVGGFSPRAGATPA